MFPKPPLPTPSLSKLFAMLLNLAIDINQDADTDALEGRSFAVAIDELPQDIGITVENGKVVALDDAHIPDADVTVSGNIKAIINMIQNEDGLDNDELYIAGKISTAKHFQHFLASLSIDWQGFFAKFMPEDSASKFADAIEQSIHFAKGSAEQFGEGLKKYLLEDKKLFVTRTEFEALRDSVDALNARLDALLEKLSG